MRASALGNTFLITFSRAPAPHTDIVVRACADLGADGLIVCARADEPGVITARVLNRDGSDGGVSGNGACVVARAAIERFGDPVCAVRFPGREMRVDPEPAGPGGAWAVEVDLGAVSFGLGDLPADAALLGAPDARGLRVLDGERVALASVGNPHVVRFCGSRDAARAWVGARGAALESHAAFPERVNVHGAWAASADRLVVYSHERGVGPTDACATGACAALACGARAGFTGSEAVVRMVGGDARVRWGGGDAGVRYRGGVSALSAHVIDPV